MECKESDFITRITRIWTLDHVKLKHSSMSTWDFSCSVFMSRLKSTSSELLSVLVIGVERAVICSRPVE